VPTSTPSVGGGAALPAGQKPSFWDRVTGRA
jgi:hypothetical protein